MTPHAYQYCYRGYTIRIQPAHPVSGQTWYWQISTSIGGEPTVIWHQLAATFQQAITVTGELCTSAPNRAEQDYPLDSGLQDCEGAV